ncbi:MAG TPA: UDP-N-acetylglucosamine 2-epimerase [Anaerolineales bacterium]|nr:UDP-N-acetylglucosamine 2-epimerase [Anaerolineales bacterium]
MTDSDGVQKGPQLLGVRCITLGEETEWVETASAGWNNLVGVNRNKIVDTYKTWRPQGERAPLYADGQSAVKICNLIFTTLS